MKELIKKLVEAKGPSGYEQEVRALIRDEIKGVADEISVDAMGSLIARKGSKGKDGLRIMFAAHMDEIGVIVTNVCDKGFVRFTNIGGVRPLNCVGGRVLFMNGTRGVIAVERLDDPGKAPTLEQLYIDVGATSLKDSPVKVGDVGVFDRPFTDLGDRLVSKAMDDRIACAVLVEVMKQVRKSPHEMHFVFSTQEEVGLRGAGTAAFGIDPDLGISVDVTLTGDTPKSSRMAVALGKGPAVKVKDGRMLSHTRVIDLMVTSAEKAGLPYQYEVLEGGSTDAAAIQLVHSGVPVGCVSIPCRYVHTPSEMVDYNDVQNAVKLILQMVAGPIDLSHK